MKVIPLTVEILSTIVKGEVKEEDQGWSVWLDYKPYILVFKFTQSGDFAGLYLELFKAPIISKPVLNED